MIPNWSWNWENLQISGLTEIWYCGQSAGKGRIVRRSWKFSTRGSAEKLSTARIHCGQSAKGPQTVRQRLCRICQRQCQSGCSVKIQRRTVRQDIADGPPDAPVSFGYTDDVSTMQARTVRQVYRGRSAWDKLNPPRKVTNIGLILSHLNWKVLKLIIFTSGWGT